MLWLQRELLPAAKGCSVTSEVTCATKRSCFPITNSQSLALTRSHSNAAAAGTLNSQFKRLACFSGGAPEAEKLNLWSPMNLTNSSNKGLERYHINRNLQVEFMRDRECVPGFSTPKSQGVISMKALSVWSRFNQRYGEGLTPEVSSVHCPSTTTALNMAIIDLSAPHSGLLHSSRPRHLHRNSLSPSADFMIMH